MSLDFLELPLEIQVKILAEFKGLAGLLRCVSTNIKQLVDSFPKIFEKPRCTVLSECFESVQLFEYTRKYSPVPFTDASVKRAIKLNKFPTDVAKVAFSLVPFKYTRIIIMMRKDRTDLLSLLSENWMFPNLSREQLLVLAKFAFLGSEYAVNWMGRILLKHFKIVRSKLLKGSTIFVDRLDIENMKKNVVCYPNIAINIVFKEYSTTSFTLQHWIELYSFAKDNYPYFRITVSHVDIDFKIPDDSTKALDYLKSIMQQISTFIQMWKPKFDIKMMVFEKLFIPCFHLSLIECVNYLLFDYGLWNVNIQILFDSSGLNFIGSTFPPTDEFLSHWIKLHRNSQNSNQNFPTLSLDFLVRLISHKQVDLISKHFAFFNDYECYNIFQMFIYKEPIRALTHPDVVRFFIDRCVLCTSDTTWSQYFFTSLPESFHAIFRELAQTQGKEFYFTCLYRHLKPLEEGYQENVVLRILDETYGAFDQHQEMHKWLFSLSLFSTVAFQFTFCHNKNTFPIFGSRETLFPTDRFISL